MKSFADVQTREQTDSEGDAGSKLRIVHAAVAGRTRIQIPPLYRNQALARQLQHAVEGRQGIHAIQANPRTARALIWHDKNITAEQLLETVQAALASSLCEAPRARRAEQNSSANVTSLSAHRRKRGNLPQSAQADDWHQLSLEEALRRLGVDPHRGLSMETVAARLDQYGRNRLDGPASRSQLSMLIEQFMSVPVGLLGASAVVSIMTGGLVDALAIVVVVMINAGIGFFTERQAENTINALSRVSPSRASVLREGRVQAISVADLVPGEVLKLEPGTVVGADARLLSSNNLTIDESALTGESMSVNKSARFRGDADTPLSERRNMCYMGTLVTGGGGDAVVVATGYQTELGQIQRMVGEASAPETPMQRQLGTMGTQLAIVSGAVCAGVFGIGLLRGQSFLQMLNGAISLAVAAVPEGLPAVATTTLAMGIRDMRKRKVAIRHIDAVETLGSVQVLCLDKTGTLTVNRMSVVALYLDGRHLSVAERTFFADSTALDPQAEQTLLRLLQLISLCSDTRLEEHGELAGSPTENAMVKAAMDGGVDVAALREQYPRRQERQRAEDRPYMVTLHASHEGDGLIAVKGSPDDVLAMCDRIVQDGEPRALEDATRDRILAENDELASDGLRVLGVAYAYTDAGSLEDLPGLIWVGLVGMADPLRSGMKSLMRTFHRAGIKTVMITGDQTATAYQIGKQLNLAEGKSLQILDSTKLQKLDPALLGGVVKKTHVFARVNPAHKLQIVQALQAGGAVVAMTGDGINDGPALKAADIGIAMGGARNDVARSVADVVVEDDNLTTLVNAVSQGRTIYSNIRKTIHYLLSTNLSEIELMLASISLGLGQPLKPMQLLWINLITDIFPGLALSMEAAEPDVMQRPPRSSEEQIIRRRDLLRMARESGVITGASLAGFAYGRLRYGPGAQANTLAFNSLVLAQLLHALACRSDSHSIFSRAPLPPNPAMRWSIGASVGIHLLAMLLPGGRKLLGVTPLSALDALVVAGGAGVPLLINESLKHKRVRSGETSTQRKPTKTKKASVRDEE